MNRIIHVVSSTILLSYIMFVLLDFALAMTGFYFVPYFLFLLGDDLIYYTLAIDAALIISFAGYALTTD